MKRLLIRPGAIGDTIVALPVLAALTTPETEIWVSRPCIPLVKFAPRAVDIVAQGTFLLGLPGLDVPVDVFHRLESFDSIISWYGLEEPHAIEQLRRHCPDVTILPGGPGRALEHAVDFHLRHAAPLLSGAVPEPFPVVHANPVHRAPFIAFQPFASGREKEWPFESFLAVERRLQPFSVRWFIARDRLPLSGSPLGEVVTHDDLGTLADDLAGATGFLGNDSGLSHLAAALGVPCVALFGPTNPAVWAPRGRAAVEVVESPTGEMRDIPGDVVFNAMHGLKQASHRTGAAASQPKPLLGTAIRCRAQRHGPQVVCPNAPLKVTQWPSFIVPEDLG